MERDEDRDPLTGLPRAGALQRKLDQLALRGASGQIQVDSFTVILVSIRDFSEVYSRLGQATGDGLLVAIAERLVGRAGAEFVAKVGGDQFALFRQRPAGESAGQWARTIRLLLREPFDVGSEKIDLRFQVTFVNGPKADGRDLLWLAIRVAQVDKERELVQELDTSRQLAQQAQALLLENVAMRENTAILVRNTDAMKKDMVDLRREANTDYLTALLNRRGLDRTLSSGQQLTALAFVDLDDLKEINERDELWDDGDAAIVGVARILRESLDTALIVRWGGDEFLVAELEGTSDQLCEQLTDLVKKCRNDVIVAGKPVTFSAGVASFDSDFKSSRAIAQQRVKRAKDHKATVDCGD
ncbi:MAG TPA: diguanylate cyclase [Acidimicrobiales bacterium]|nr:diguanylate cyclase [Acidimicrobiales bacterium]